MARKPAPAPVSPPELPPTTEREKALELQILTDLSRLADWQHQRNLNNAVLLAKQAARGDGPLVNHFAEIGRRYGDTLVDPPAPELSVVKGRRT